MMFATTSCPWLADADWCLHPDGARVPVAWPIHVFRHFGGVADALAMDSDPFATKRSRAVWRGAASGVHVTHSQRWHLVQQLVTLDAHPELDIGLIDDPQLKRVLQKLPSNVYGNLISTNIKPVLSRSQMWGHKMIIFVEGNDVSSGLKWGLATSSAVLMPPPTATSWAMEGRLVPWRHYVPLAQNVSDLADKARWCLDNEAKCEEIGLAGRCFVLQFLDEQRERAVAAAVATGAATAAERTGAAETCRALFPANPSEAPQDVCRPFDASMEDWYV